MYGSKSKGIIMTTQQIVKKKNNIISDQSDKPISKSSVHYVSNPKLLNEFVMWKADIAQALLEDKPEPKIPEAIGLGIMQIAGNFSKKYNWHSNAKYREEMTSDAIVNCILYVRNFDPTKSNNPFAYFTQISYFAFLRRIEKEKTADYIRHKSMANSILYQEMQDGNVDDEDNLVLEDFTYDATGVSDFITTFELKNFNKKLNDNEIAGIGGQTRILEEKNEVGFL